MSCPRHPSSRRRDDATSQQHLLVHGKRVHRLEVEQGQKPRVQAARFSLVPALQRFPHQHMRIGHLAGRHRPARAPAILLQRAPSGHTGRYLLEEYRRGACGTMPACEVADAHVLVWEALERRDETEARRLHTRLLPLLNFEAMYSFTVYKEVLLRRGVIASARTRVAGAGHLDAESRRELDLLLRDLEPLLTLGARPSLEQSPGESR